MKDDSCYRNGRSREEKRVHVGAGHYEAAYIKWSTTHTRFDRRNCPDSPVAWTPTPPPRAETDPARSWTANWSGRCDARRSAGNSRPDPPVSRASATTRIFSWCSRTTNSAAPLCPALNV